ncbi:MAG: DUF1232 domain-containing protein [Austwickia sp.]|jgi:uncharacterized membrane protein YkvA (DUF1232 family)|nr:MAG: DUF1232 domain-containing protein [Austwickia sp.]
MSLRWQSVSSVARAARATAQPGSPSWSERLAALPRLSAQAWSGAYQGLSRKRLLMMVAAALYVVSPADLFPEGVLGLFGLGDDAIAIAWLAAALVGETQSFLEWERRGSTVPSSVV